MTALLKHYLANQQQTNVYTELGNYIIDGMEEEVKVWMCVTDRNLFAITDSDNTMLCTSSFENVFIGLKLK